jgi:hypothetical protein
MPDTTEVTNAQTTATIPAEVKPPEAKPGVATEAKVTDPKQDASAQRFAALAKRERAIVKKQEEWKSQQSEWESFKKEREEWKAARAKDAEVEALKRTSPLKWLEAQGITYNDLTAAALAGGKPPPDMAVREIKEEFESYKAQQERMRKEAADAEKARQQAEYDRVVEEFKAEVNQFIDGKKEEYELITLHAATPVVYATIEEHFANTKKVLSIKDASDLVEKWLEDQVAKSLETKKLKAKVSPTTAKEPDKKLDNGTAQPRTITNTMATSTPSMLPAQTEQDRMKRAMAALTR